MNPKEYFKNHLTQLWLLKHGIALLMPGLLMFAIVVVQEFDSGMWWAAAVLGILNIAHQKISALDPDKEWPVVGKKKK